MSDVDKRLNTDPRVQPDAEHVLQSEREEQIYSAVPLGRFTSNDAHQQGNL